MGYGCASVVEKEERRLNSCYAEQGVVSWDKKGTERGERAERKEDILD